jgi:cytochrome P450/NADPH-cytochrome P450 reductase
VQTVDPGTARAAVLRQPDAALGRVVENRILTKSGVPVKRHIGKWSGNLNMCLNTDSVP